VVVIVNTCAHSLGPGFKPLFGHYSESFFLHVTESPIFFFPSQFLLGTAFYHCHRSGPTAPCNTTAPSPPRPPCCAAHSPLPSTATMLAPPYSAPPPHAPPAHCTHAPKPPHSGAHTHPFLPLPPLLHLLQCVLPFPRAAAPLASSPL